MSDITSLVTGLSTGLNNYLGNQQQLQNQENLAKYKNDLTTPDQSQPASQVTPDLAENVLPGMGGQMVNSFKDANGRFPTVDEAHKFLDDAKARLGRADTQGDKEQANQDKLEKQATDRLTQVRGDTSLMRVEHQRDSAGMAYDTIAKAMSEKRPLTELEQTDLIGQLWQARTGKAPTDNDMKMLNDRTAKRGLNQTITYITGDPTLVGASTDKTMANLKQFIEATGSKADQQWNAYMAPRMTKPTSLDDDRWQHVVSQHRGIPFGDQKKVSDTTYKVAGGVGGASDIEAKKAALRAKLGL